MTSAGITASDIHSILGTSMTHLKQQPKQRPKKPIAAVAWPNMAGRPEGKSLNLSAKPVSSDICE